MTTVERVRSHPYFRNELREKQIELAAEFSDFKQVKEKFNHLLDIEDQLTATREDANLEYLHSLEKDAAKKRQKHDVAIACDLPVKLFLSRLKGGTPPFAGPLTSMLGFEYGPLHAGLIVKDIKIEWDDSNLVTPWPAPLVAGDLVAHCHEGGQWEEKVEQLVKDMSMANRRNHATSQRLEVLYESRHEKEKLIDNLVRVIVDYNTKKKYNVFSCNCQNFVIDAMRALGIKEPPHFKGRLNDYLQALKRGEKAPLDFQTHEDLDQYVKSSLAKLDKTDREYFLCLYFQFHLPKLENLAPEEVDEWRCPIRMCQCKSLEEMVEQDGLLFHQFRRNPEPLGPDTGPSGPRRILARPSLLPVHEQVEESPDGFPYSRFMARGECEIEHKTRLLQCTGYNETIKSKLRSCPEYSRLTEEEIQKLGDILTEKEEFRQQYLSSYIDETSEEVVFEASLDYDLTATLTAGDSRRRSNERFEKLVNPRLQLVHFCKGRASGGDVALSTILQVGDYLYHWDDRSIVIPKECEQVLDKPVLFTPLLHCSRWCSEVRKQQGKMKSATEKGDYGSQIDLLFNLNEKKDIFFMKFIANTLKFNREMHYDEDSCNNLTFLTKSMKSLGIKTRPTVSSTLNEHIEQIRDHRLTQQCRIADHEELDKTVQNLSSQFCRGDIDFLLAKYFLFHTQEWDKARMSSAGTWACPIVGCKLKDLESQSVSWYLNASVAIY